MRLSDGRTQLVHLTIAGTGDIAVDPSSDLYQNLVDRAPVVRRSIQPVQVCSRRVKLWSSTPVCASIRSSRGNRSSRDPCGTAGGLRRRGARSRSAGISQRGVAMMQAVEGVASVDPQVLTAVAEDTTAAQLLQLATTLTVRPFVAAETRSGSRPPAPRTRRRIRPADLVFLTPDLPATLILTEIGGWRALSDARSRSPLRTRAGRLPAARCRPGLAAEGVAAASSPSR